jgi:hypothetical protein
MAEESGEMTSCNRDLNWIQLAHNPNWLGRYEIPTIWDAKELNWKSLENQPQVLMQLNQTIALGIASVAHKTVDSRFTHERIMETQGLIASHFHDRGINPARNLDKLSSIDGTLLTLGLTLQLVDECVTGQYPHEIAFLDVHWRRKSSSYSGRDRTEFFLQQAWKYNFDSETDTPAKMFLQHCNSVVEDEKTRYLYVQETNVNFAADNFKNTVINRTGRLQIGDIKDLFGYLLEGIVPKGHERDLRSYDGKAVSDSDQTRPDFTAHENIEKDLTQFLSDISSTVRELREEGDKEMMLKHLTRWRIIFDLIHPGQESNGRAGSVLVKALYEYMTKNQETLVFSREDELAYEKAISRGATAVMFNQNKKYTYQSADSILFFPDTAFQAQEKELLDFLRSQSKKVRLTL